MKVKHLKHFDFSLSSGFTLLLVNYEKKKRKMCKKCKYIVKERDKGNIEGMLTL